MVGAAQAKEYVQKSTNSVWRSEGSMLDGEYGAKARGALSAGLMSLTSPQRQLG